MIEKRRHKRIPISSSATLKFKDQISSPLMETMVANISQSGIGLYADKRVESGIRISVTVKFVSIDGNIYTESLDGRIVYVNMMGYLYFMGVEFDEEINETAQPHLYEYLQEALRSN